MRVLVVGANGQLGAQVCAALLARGHQVRGSVRAVERARGLPTDVEVVEADVATGRGVGPAVAGMEAVVFTASPVAARKGDSPRAFNDGALRVVDAVEAAGVRRFVFPSVEVTPVDDKVPPLSSKRRLEQRLEACELEHVAVRLPPFTDVWLGLVGSSVPARGEERSLLHRPSPFLQRFRRMTGTSVEGRGVIVTAAADVREHDFVSRFFAPRAGIPEDPVTGSAHCCLGPLWSARLGKPEVVGYQASARGGLVRVRPRGSRVTLAGQAVTVLRGHLV